MKKQIFSLLLSAAIFTTNPLFAMDPSQPDNEGKGSITHLCPVCEPTLRFADVKDERNGSFSILPDDPNVQILTNLSLKDMLVCSTTSKAMHNLCQKPHLWNLFAQKYTFAFNPDLCIKSQFASRFPSHFNLFREWNNGSDMEPITYNVSPAQFKAFLKTPCETTWWAYSYERKNPAVRSYQISIGEDQYELYWSPVDREKYIEDLKNRAHDIMFVSGSTHGYKDATSLQGETIFNVFYNRSIYSSIWIKKLETKQAKK